MGEAMRHRWLLLGACGWVLLILMFASKFVSFRAVDGKLSWVVLMTTGECDHLSFIRVL